MQQYQPFEPLRRIIARHDRLQLGHFPTPIEPLKRIAAKLGGPALFVKRDDASGLGRFRLRLPDTLLVSDDMQMQGLQKALGTREAGLQSLKAGMDMLCIGNNLFDQEQEMAAIAEYVEQSLRDKTLSGSAIEKSIARVAKRKALLMA